MRNFTVPVLPLGIVVRALNVCLFISIDPSSVLLLPSSENIVDALITQAIIFCVL